MEIRVSGAGDLRDPANRILAIEAAAEAITRSGDGDPADMIMSLLVAAVHQHMKRGKGTIKDRSTAMAEALGCAIVTADDWFNLKEIVGER